MAAAHEPAGDPHMHVHQPTLNKVTTERDSGKRTIDGRGIYRERAQAAAVGTVTMENDLARDLGVEYVLRADGHGREIKGIPQALIDEYSRRARRDIAPEMQPMIDAYRATWGHDPDEYALAAMGHEAQLSTREPKRAEDPVALVRDWARRAREASGQELAPIAAQVCGPAQARREFTGAQRREVVRRAVSDLQARRSTFTEPELARSIQEHLPEDLPVMSSEDALRLVPDMTRMAVDAGLVIPLQAPEIFSPPDTLRRQDGESVFTQHRAARYATDAQMAREARILEGMAARGAPCADPDRVAALLGADRAALEAQLAPDAPADVTTVTESGLLLSQAAAAFAIMTSDRRTDILVGPAGTGKSTTIAALARIWPQLHEGARVIALTETQAGANVLKSMGVSDSHNVSMFLTDRRLRESIPAGSLIMVDEGSMVTMPHLDSLISIAGASNAKLPIAGDHAQHQAVQAGGGMAMGARRQGSLQLVEALRFTSEWERVASLRLRAGDQAVLPAYEQHGRIVAGGREQMMEEAYRRWLGDHLAGTESVLIARENADALELSRRARADLIRYGVVADGPTAALQEGAVCSAGDRIMARLNVHEQGLANRQVYEVREVLPDGSVRAALTSDGTIKTLDADYLAGKCHLCYGITSHAAQGATFSGNGYAIVRETDNREYAYTAMTRGASGNFAFAVTSQKEQPSWRNVAAPEVARARELAKERDGTSPGPELRTDSGTWVLSRALARDDAELSATETLERAFSDADSLANLVPVWKDLSGGEYARRYTVALRDLLGSDAAREVAADHRYTWLCRTLRAGEMAGLAGEMVLAEAAAGGPLDDAESVCAVLDKRARDIIPATVPMHGGWAARTPRMPEPGTDGLLADVSRAMDERTARLGEHVAATMPLWARELGELQAGPGKRADWVDRAGEVAAYREMKEWDSGTDPLGPCPNISEPVERAAWHSALTALARTDGIDLTGLSDAELETRRRAYERETARAPAHVGRELMLSRMAADQAAMRADRSAREAQVAADAAVRARHEANAVRWGSLRDRARQASQLYAEAMAVRDDWHRIAEPTLRNGKAADLESRRRDPWARKDALRNAEPDSGLADAGASDADRLAAIGLTPDSEVLSDHPQRMAEAARDHQARLDELAWLPEPVAGDEDGEIKAAPAWGADALRQREAVTQPAQPMIRPSQRVLEADFEAG